jgi:hypothetical protein
VLFLAGSSTLLCGWYFLCQGAGNGSSQRNPPTAPAAVSPAPMPGVDPNHLYATHEHCGPDRCATAWLIKRFVDKEARFSFTKLGTAPEQGTPFDVPGSEIGHQGPLCAFQVALKRYGMENDKALQKIGASINDVMPEAADIEQRRDIKLQVHEWRRQCSNDDQRVFEIAFVWLDELYASFGGDVGKLGQSPRNAPVAATPRENAAGK